MPKSHDEVIGVLRAYRAAIRRDFRVDAVVLFGSYARETADDWSDIDVAIVSPDFATASPLEVLRRLAHAKLEADPAISPLPLTPERWANPATTDIAHEVRRYGKVLGD